MADQYIDIIITEPVLLDIATEPIYYIGTSQSGPKGDDGDSAYQVWLDEGNIGTEQDFLDSLKGDQGDPFSFVEGSKSSATDAGTLGDISITDDYIYWCVKTGTAGNAIWKKAVIFAT